MNMAVLPTTAQHGGGRFSLTVPATKNLPGEKQMAKLGDHIRTLDIPEPQVAPAIVPVHVPEKVEEKTPELVPLRRQA